MASTQAVLTNTHLEDPLAHLPCSRIVAYRRGDIIYSPGQPSMGLYLVIDGRVKVCRSADDTHEVVIDIYRTDELFGESAFLGVRRGEQAIALERASLMSWTSTEIDDFLEKRPRLAVALLQTFVQRELDLSCRIASFAADKTSRRLARSLIRFSDRLGTLQADGSVRMAPFTHKLLAQYVGTSREEVTYFMNRFRQHGYLRYSRDNITLYREALTEWLRHSHGIDRSYCYSRRA